MADVVGYTKLMEADEKGTHSRVLTLLRELVEPSIIEHRGRHVRSKGDGFLAMFESPVEAVRCAIVIQQNMLRCNLELYPGRGGFSIGSGSISAMSSSSPETSTARA
jgi:class 3 adenylate cyclase